MTEASCSQAKQGPIESPEETKEATASEVQRVNRILEIESMDWERQLQQAVSGYILQIFCKRSLT